MTNTELGNFFIDAGAHAQAEKVLSQLIPQLVAFNSVIFQALGGNTDAAEPAVQELLALSTLTADMYALRTQLQTYLRGE